MNIVKIGRIVIVAVYAVFLHANCIFAQKDGYTNILTIKQPFHTFNSTKLQDTKKAFQKVNGLLLSTSQKLLVISYSYDPVQLVIYKVGTWEQVGVYQIKGAGVELNQSYFSDDDKMMYVRYDRYATNYKIIEFKTGYIKKIDCSKTPAGCGYEEIRQDQKELTTDNRKYYIAVSSFDPSDVIVYIKKQ